MTGPVAAGASWASVDDIPESALALHPDAGWAGFLGMATDILWAATGRRWRGVGSTAQVTLRAAPPRAGEGGWPYHRSWGQCPCFAGVDPNWLPRWAVGTLAHHGPAAVRLPHPDVTAVTAVTVDGAAFAGWRLDGSWLARTDGHGWLVCHDRSIVGYAYGHAPPAAGRAACLELAVEFGRAGADEPDQPCRLPKRLQSVTRQGITFAVLDSLEFLDKGWTGLLAVDMWIRAVNPKGRAQAATVWSPDISRARSTT